MQTSPSLFSLTGKVCIVTGATGGIGGRAARALAAHGASVVCVARRRAELDRLVDDIREAGGQARAVALDVTDSDGLEPIFEAAAALGTLSTVVNAVGLSGPRDRADVLSMADWRAMLALNLDAVFAVNRLAAARMIASGVAGSLINVSSIAAIGATSNSSAYCAAKAGLGGLTRSMALDFGPHGIRSNCIEPGPTRTPMMPDAVFETDFGRHLVEAIPLARPAEPSDFDGLMVFLASDASRYLSGVCIPVDGGLSARLAGF